MLEQIGGPADVKAIPVDDLPRLAEEIRDFLIRSVSKTGDISVPISVSSS